MTRLTRHIRETIISNAVTLSGVRARVEEVEAKKAALALEIRVFGLGGQKAADDIDKWVKKHRKSIVEFIEKNPKLRISSTYPTVALKDCVQVNFSGLMDTLWFPLDGDSLPIPQSVAFRPEHQLYKDWEKIEGELKNAKDAVNAVRDAVAATLRSVPTTKALLKAWPEAVELLPTALEKEEKWLPAIARESLNTLIKLPVDKKK